MSRMLAWTSACAVSGLGESVSRSLAGEDDADPRKTRPVDGSMSNSSPWVGLKAVPKVSSGIPSISLARLASPSKTRGPRSPQEITVESAVSRISDLYILEQPSAYAYASFPKPLPRVLRQRLASAVGGE